MVRRARRSRRGQAILPLVVAGLNAQYAGMALTLAEALRSGRLPEFVAQQEAAGLAPADRDAFERIVKGIIPKIYGINT